MEESNQGILTIKWYSQTAETGEVSVKRVMFYKSTIHLLFEHNTKEIKQDIKIVKLNISNLENVVICRLQMFMKTLKRRSFIHNLVKKIPLICLEPCWFLSRSIRNKETFLLKYGIRELKASLSIK